MEIFPKLISRFNMILIKIADRFLAQIDELILIFFYENSVDIQGTQNKNAQNNLVKDG